MAALLSVPAAEVSAAALLSAAFAFASEEAAFALSAAGVEAAACFGAASFREESPRIWKESTDDFTAERTSSLLTDASML